MAVPFSSGYGPVCLFFISYTDLDAVRENVREDTGSGILPDQLHLVIPEELLEGCTVITQLRSQWNA